MQGVPKKRKKLDTRCKTIENDPHFLQFVENKENLSKVSVNLPSVEDYLEEIEAKEKESKTLSTPLLDFLNKRKGIGSSSSKKRQSTREDMRKKENSSRRKTGWKDEASGQFKSNKESNRSGNRDKEGNRDKDSKDGNKDSNRENRNPGKRERYRRRRDKDKGDDKSIDKLTNKKISNSSTSQAKKEEPKMFTVKILTNEKRISNQSNAEGKAKSNTTTDAPTSSKDNSKRSSDKVRNRERPSIQIYRPPRQSQSKEDSNSRK